MFSATPRLVRAPSTEDYRSVKTFSAPQERGSARCTRSYAAHGFADWRALGGKRGGPPTGWPPRVGGLAAAAALRPRQVAHGECMHGSSVGTQSPPVRRIW